LKQYYTQKLVADRLKRCYDIATPRVKQYLEAEIQHVLKYIKPSHLVIELGCGYGRVLQRVAGHTTYVIGIDTASESLNYAIQNKFADKRSTLLQMDAACLGFQDAVFDVLICIQNGISAFKVDPQHLIQESVRVTKPEGICLFSSYCEEFWEPRLEWFQLQAENGLLGEIDWDETHDGIIVCHDGFKATTMSITDFNVISQNIGIQPRIVEVDNSSLFLELIPGNHTSEKV
jgi:2-polyprenyl-6-hydroxyphenyl methylase/3-demethylubiquinone-9 3-methyltransferase